MLIAGTGHRMPGCFPGEENPYTAFNYRQLVQFARNTISALQPTTVISGGAIGWDQALAQAAINLDIPLHLYIPFPGQESNWPWKTKAYYKQLLEKAKEVKICSSEGYAAWKMQKRNEDMVRDCNKLLALFNGQRGGTYNCIQFAEKTHREIINCWPQWLIFKDK